MAAETASAQLDPSVWALLSAPLVALTGAGLSTDSGIPDYRGPGSIPRSPMTYQEFVSGDEAQQRYWARSFVGWQIMGHAEPNPGHYALAEIAPRLLITQNVDGLHERAGSSPVVALHGRVSEVICLGCRAITARQDLQQRLAELNPEYVELARQAKRLPDGDAQVELTHGFRVVRCAQCGERLKPHVVFFGETVPAPRVQECFAAVEQLADLGGTLLVAGTSLTVMSGLRFVRRAAALDIPIVVVNRGETRGDPLATHKLELGCAEFLTTLASRRAGSRVAQI